TLISEPVSHIVYVAQVEPGGQPFVKQPGWPTPCALTGCRVHRSKHARARLLNTTLLRIKHNENVIVIFCSFGRSIFAQQKSPIWRSPFRRGRFTVRNLYCLKHAPLISPTERESLQVMSSRYLLES